MNKKFNGIEPEIIGLFPTPVCRYKLGRAFLSKELKFISSRQLASNRGNSVSKDRYVLKQKSLSGLNQFAEDSVNHYVKTILCPKHDVSMRITQSWLNYTKKEGFHHHHHHPNSFISGVFYIEADDTKDKIIFSSPSALSTIELFAEEYNVFNSRDWWLSTGTGDLLLFPSTLAHYVPPTETESRISLSFNTFPVGYVGNEENLTALHL